MSLLFNHLQGKVTQVCRCWALTRRDGRVFGFTDHDLPLSFDGITFKAESGMTARALEQVTGLAVDNSEAVGALSDVSVTEADISAGRFDGAKVQAWLVNWQDVSIRELQFAGSVGEIKSSDGAFHAELRGISEGLNQPVGQVFQRGCQALLGDARCRVLLEAPEYRVETPILEVRDNRVLILDALSSYEAGWFERGRLDVTSGAGEGIVAAIKSDREEDGSRVIELWEEIRAVISEGDTVLLEVGCDKRKETCRDKFDNLLNFRGFPHIPGEDWLMGYPTSTGRNDGGSRYQ